VHPGTPGAPATRQEQTDMESKTHSGVSNQTSSRLKIGLQLAFSLTVYSISAGSLAIFSAILVGKSDRCFMFVKAFFDAGISAG
jgi:hypothetical protein